MLKKFFAAIMAISVLGAYAETVEVNLLQDAYIHSDGVFNTPDEFFANWSCYFENGNLVMASEWPSAGYSEVLLDEYGVPCYYTSISAENFTANRIPGNNPASAEVFPAGMPLLKLVYPGGKNDMHYSTCSYNFPINVPEDGEYTISGSIAISLSGSNNSAINNYKLILFAANPNPAAGISSISIMAGGVSLLNGEGAPLYNAFMAGSVVMEQSQKFQKTLTLTTNDKYLSIFAPCGTLLLGGLKLTGNIEGHALAVNALETGEQVPEYYDLSGRKITTPFNSVAPGIYIERLPTTTRKILK